MVKDMICAGEHSKYNWSFYDDNPEIDCNGCVILQSVTQPLQSQVVGAAREARNVYCNCNIGITVRKTWLKSLALLEMRQLCNCNLNLYYVSAALVRRNQARLRYTLERRWF